MQSTRGLTMNDIDIQLKDLERGSKSVIIDAFRSTKAYFGGEKLDTHDSFVRSIFQKYVSHNRYYIYKSEDGVRYSVTSPNTMFNFFTSHKSI